MKVCSKCKIEKEFSEFHKDKYAKSGYYPSCKPCNKVSVNKEQKAIYLQEYCNNPENKEKLKEKRKEYYSKPDVKERQDRYTKEYNARPDVKERMSLQKKEYNARPEIREKVNLQQKHRFHNDIQYKIGSKLRRRLKSALKTNQKVGSAVSDLGCSIEDLKKYLESKFQDGMSWDNYGFYGWHIDHILPLASFDLTDREQFLKACHYTNLQPLWALDNLKKGDKIL